MGKRTPIKNPGRFCDALLTTLERLREENRASELRAAIKKQIREQIKRIEELIAQECASESEKARKGK